MRLHNQRKDKPTDPASCFNVGRTFDDAVLLSLYYYSMLDTSSKAWLKHSASLAHIDIGGHCRYIIIRTIVAIKVGDGLLNKVQGLS